MDELALAREILRQIRVLEAELPDWLRGVIRERFDQEDELCNLERLIQDPATRKRLWPLLPPLQKLAGERLYQTHLARAIAEAYARTLEGAPETLRQWATAYRLNVRLRCPASGPYKTQDAIAEAEKEGEDFARLYAALDLDRVRRYANWLWDAEEPPRNRVYLVVGEDPLRFLLVRETEREAARNTLGLAPEKALSEALFPPFRGPGWWSRPGVADFVRKHLRLFPPEVARIARGSRVDLSRWTERYRRELLEQGRNWRDFLAGETNETPGPFALEIPLAHLQAVQELTTEKRGPR